MRNKVFEKSESYMVVSYLVGIFGLNIMYNN